nr:MAG TPA: hypothetical protein [Caudoviricetes sp.]
MVLLLRNRANNLISSNKGLIMKVIGLLLLNFSKIILYSIIE